MKRFAKAVLIVAAVFLVGFFALIMGVRYLFLGQFTAPTSADFVKIAQNNQYIVQAAYDFKAEHGLWPQQLADLTPNYLASIPSYPPMLENQELMIPAPFPHTGITYSFLKGHEGWSANGDFGTGPLPLPKMASTRPALSADELIKATLAEYDRRIALHYSSDSTYYVYRNYTQKIVYLLSIGKKTDAMDTCQSAAKTYPDWWRPPVVTAMLADPSESAQAEAGLRAWVGKYPTFIHYWYLSRYYRDHGRQDMALDSLRSAVKHSLAETDADGTWVPDAHAFDAADFACQQRQPELVLDITRLWALPRGVYNYHNDNLDVFKAAAELQQGHFDESAADLDRIMQKGNTGSLWTHNLDQLHHAISAKDKSFTYDAGSLPGGWTLLPPLD